MALYAKLYTDILADRKLMRAARQGAKRLHLLPWLIVFAKEAQDGGRLSIGGTPADPIDIAEAIPCVTPADVKKCEEELVAIGVLAREPDGAFRFVRWHRRQSKPSDQADEVRLRVQDHRERNAPSNAGSNAPGNADSNATSFAGAGNPDLDPDQDKDPDPTAKRAGTGYSPEFECVWEVYPSRPNNSKAGAWRAWKARVKAGESPAVLLAGARAYAAYVEREGTDPRYVKLASTFFGPDQHYRNDYGQSHRDEPEIVFADQMPGAAERAAAFTAARDAALAGVTRG